MPKEIIRSHDENNPVIVHVGWNPNGEVQIATLNPLVEEPTPGSSERGWYGTYDRNGLNELIRTLRRARDAAYGADA